MTGIKWKLHSNSLSPHQPGEPFMMAVATFTRWFDLFFFVTPQLSPAKYIMFTDEVLYYKISIPVLFFWQERELCLRGSKRFPRHKSHGMWLIATRKKIKKRPRRTCNERNSACVTSSRVTNSSDNEGFESRGSFTILGTDAEILLSRAADTPFV